jgi:hypothetical protein
MFPQLFFIEVKDIFYYAIFRNMHPPLVHQFIVAGRCALPSHAVNSCTVQFHFSNCESVKTNLKQKHRPRSR